VRNYDVDGIHLDYVRYGGAAFGYNPTSVARFNARYGTAGQPDAADPRWADWRREQVTALVRQVYLEAIAIQPQVMVSAATIAWGAGPASDADWPGTRTCAEVFQDWPAWLREESWTWRCR